VEALLGLNSSTDSEAQTVAKALRCVEAEHVYAGVPCGVMDQFVSAAGLADNLLLIDCRSDTATHVPFLDGDVSIVVCNSNVKHSLDGSEYPTRVKQVRRKSVALVAAERWASSSL
jgi:galactokinase